MLKHMNDQGNLNLLIDNSGGLLVVCAKCKKVWSGALQLTEVNTEMEGVERAHASSMISALMAQSPAPDFLSELNLPDIV